MKPCWVALAVNAKTRSVLVVSFAFTRAEVLRDAQRHQRPGYVTEAFNLIGPPATVAQMVDDWLEEQGIEPGEAIAVRQNVMEAIAEMFSRKS